MILKDTLNAERGFCVTCAHCLKRSRFVPLVEVTGQPIVEAVKMAGMQLLNRGKGGIVVCNKWCAWRYGRKSGVHHVLNVLFGKTELLKS